MNSASAPSGKRDWLIAAALLLPVAACFAGVAQYEFVFDDRPHILENLRIQSWEFLPRYFTEQFLAHLDASPGYTYRPALLLWMRLNWWAFGPNPAAWHLAALLVHLTATWLVFRLTRQLGGDEAVAAFAALFFGLHPVHVEPVAWVMGVTEPLVAIFAFGSVVCYLRWRDSDGSVRGWLWGALLLLTIALLVKENAVVVAAILAGLELIRGRATETDVPVSHYQRLRAAALRLAPVFAVVALYLALRLAILGALSRAVTPLPLSTLLFTWPSVLWFYARLLAAPFNLSAFYDTPFVTRAEWATFFAPLILLGVVAAGLFWACRRSPVAAAAALWLVLPLALVLNFTVFPAEELAHDRYLYLPSVGFCILLALAVKSLPGRARFLGLPVIPLAAALAISASYGVSTWRQKAYWRDNFTLYSRGVKIAPLNNLAANNLANELLARGQTDAALALYQQVLARNPDYYLSQYNLGYLYYKLGRFTDAERHLSLASRLSPYDADSRTRLGALCWRQGRLAEAEAHFRRAIELRPLAPGFYYSLGVVLEAQGKLDQAAAAYRTEMAFDPWRKLAAERLLYIQSRQKNTSPGKPDGSRQPAPRPRL